MTLGFSFLNQLGQSLSIYSSMSVEEEHITQELHGNFVASLDTKEWTICSFSLHSEYTYLLDSGR